MTNTTEPRLPHTREEKKEVMKGILSSPLDRNLKKVVIRLLGEEYQALEKEIDQENRERQEAHRQRGLEKLRLREKKRQHRVQVKRLLGVLKEYNAPREYPKTQAFLQSWGPEIQVNATTRVLAAEIVYRKCYPLSAMTVLALKRRDVLAVEGTKEKTWNYIKSVQKKMKV